MMATLTFSLRKSLFGSHIRSIALATVLSLIDAFHVVTLLPLAGYISKRAAPQAVPTPIFGILVFLPRFYHLRNAYYTSKGYQVTSMVTFQTSILLKSQMGDSPALKYLAEILAKG